MFSFYTTYVRYSCVAVCLCLVSPSVSHSPVDKQENCTICGLSIFATSAIFYIHSIPNERSLAPLSSRWPHCVGCSSSSRSKTDKATTRAKETSRTVPAQIMYIHVYDKLELISVVRQSGCQQLVRRRRRAAGAASSCILWHHCLVRRGHGSGPNKEQDHRAAKPVVLVSWLSSVNAKIRKANIHIHPLLYGEHCENERMFTMAGKCQ